MSREVASRTVEVRNISRKSSRSATPDDGLSAQPLGTTKGPTSSSCITNATSPLGASPAAMPTAAGVRAPVP